jgi:hypothetical protein
MVADERQRIEQDCHELIISFTHCLDHGESERAVSLFTSDGVWRRAGKSLTGRDQILASLRERKATSLVRHFTANIKIEVMDENNAEGVTYYTAYQGDAETAPLALPLPLRLPLSIGEWHDKFVRTPSGWRIALRETRRLFQRDDSRV